MFSVSTFVLITASCREIKQKKKTKQNYIRQKIWLYMYQHESPTNSHAQIPLQAIFTDFIASNGPQKA